MDPLGVLCLGVSLVIPTLVLPRMVLAPAFAAADKNRLPVQYQVSDLAMLTVYVSLALGIAYSKTLDLVPVQSSYLFQRVAHGILVGSVGLLAGCLWWIGVRTLSRAGVVRVQERMLYLALLPVIYTATTLVIPLTLLGTAGLAGTQHVLFWNVDPLFLAVLSVCILLGARAMARHRFGRVDQPPVVSLEAPTGGPPKEPPNPTSEQGQTT